MGSGGSVRPKRDSKHLRSFTTVPSDRKNTGRMSTYSLVVAGGIGAGKTSFVQQMKNIYGGPASSEDKTRYVKATRQIIGLMTIGFLEQLRDNGLEEMQDVELLTTLHDISIPYNTGQCEMLSRFLDHNLQSIRECEDLWKGELVKSLREVSHVDSIGYLMSNYSRILDVNYSPTETDFLHYHVCVRGLRKVTVHINDTMLHLYDPGSCSIQPQRKKWVHYFEKMDGIVFVAGIGDFDQFHHSKKYGRSVNLLQMTIREFEFLLRSPYFEFTPFVLLLNKVDTFEHKLASTSLRRFCPSYRGADNPESCKEFVKSLFTKRVSKHKDCYVHFTNMLETDDVLHQAIAIILNGLTVSVNLKNISMM